MFLAREPAGAARSRGRVAIVGSSAAVYVVALMDGFDPDRQAHPLAQRLFETLRGASDEDRQLVYDALRRRLEGDGPEVLGAMAEALRSRACELGVNEASVPAAAYDRWRRVATGNQAPSRWRMTTLGTGSWRHGCAIALGLPVADPRYRRMLASGKRYKREEKLAALCRFAAELPEEVRPSPWRYKPWAAGVDRSSSDAMLVPLSPLTIAGEFGSWDAALEAAGIPIRVFPAKPGQFAHPSTREDAVRALRAAADDVEPPLTMPAYDAWAQTRRLALGSTDNGREIVLPSSTLIARRFGGWRAAVREVLGADVPVGRGRRAEYSEGELNRVWHDFVVYCDGVATARMWTLYREHVSGGNIAYVVPSEETMLRRFGGGSWRGVRAHFGLDGDRLRLQRHWSEPDLVAAWRCCAEARGAAPRTFTEYDNWRQDQRRLSSPAADPLPPAGPTLMRRLGARSWRELFERLERKKLVRRERERYSDDELRAAALAAQRWLGRSPSIAGYQRYRSIRVAEDPVVSLPSIGTLLRRFGTWGELRRQLGGDSPVSGARWSQLELIEIVQQCARDLDHRPSIATYEKWRRDAVSRGVQDRPPKGATISRRLGDGYWSAAITHALEGGNTKGADR